MRTHSRASESNWDVWNRNSSGGCEESRGIVERMDAFLSGAEQGLLQQKSLQDLARISQNALHLPCILISTRCKGILKGVGEGFCCLVWGTEVEVPKPRTRLSAGDALPGRCRTRQIF